MILSHNIVIFLTIQSRDGRDAVATAEEIWQAWEGEAPAEPSNRCCEPLVLAARREPRPPRIPSHESTRLKKTPAIKTGHMGFWETVREKPRISPMSTDKTE